MAFGAAHLQVASSWDKEVGGFLAMDSASMQGGVEETRFLLGGSVSVSRLRSDRAPCLGGCPAA